MITIPTPKDSYSRWLLHALIIIGLGYSDFVSCWSLGYQEIYVHHSHKVAISLWVLAGVSQALVFWYWGLQLYYGSGSYSPIKPFDLYDERTENLTPLPEYFFCDDFGYPNWCSNCQSIKLPRARHMKHLKRCVPKTDHFCLWVGTVLGKDNYVAFIKYLIWFDSYFIIIFTYMAVYTKSNYQRGSINHNFIVLYILGGMWVCIISALFFSHIYYISRNMTTLDDVQRKNAKRPKRRGMKIQVPAKETPKEEPSKEEPSKEEPSIEKPPKEEISIPKPKPKADNPTNDSTHTDETLPILPPEQPTTKPPSQDPNIMFLNVKHNDSRVVVQASIHDNIFNHGFKVNWINLFLFNNSIYLHSRENYSTWNCWKATFICLIPIIDIFFKTEPSDGEQNGIPTLSNGYKQYIEDKISNNRCYLPSYIDKEQEH